MKGKECIEQYQDGRDISYRKTNSIKPLRCSPKKKTKKK